MPAVCARTAPGWNGALFDFYFAAAHRICADPRLPGPADHPVQLAVREALANALIHADYQDPRGLTIEKRSHQLYITNPGCFRVEPSSALAGGISDARNPGLSELFRLVGVGQRAAAACPRFRRYGGCRAGRNPPSGKICAPVPPACA